MIPNFDRFSKRSYPSFDKYISEKLISEIFQELPMDISQTVIDKIRTESEYIFDDKQFFLELKEMISFKIKKTFYFDDPYAIDHTVTMILSKMGQEHLYILFQYILTLISYKY